MNLTNGENKMNKIYTVLLKDNTTGTFTGPECKENDRVTIKFHDENGLPVKKEGIIKEILEEKEPWG